MLESYEYGRKNPVCLDQDKVGLPKASLISIGMLNCGNWIPGQTFARLETRAIWKKFETSHGKQVFSPVFSEFLSGCYSCG
jgi:hypothetical protein